MTLPELSRIRLPLAWLGKSTWAMPGHQQRIDDAEQDGQHDHHQDRGAHVLHEALARDRDRSCTHGHDDLLRPGGAPTR